MQRKINITLSKQTTEKPRKEIDPNFYPKKYLNQLPVELVEFASNVGFYSSKC